MAAKRNFVWRERDNRLLRKMGIAAVELSHLVQYSPETQAELREAIIGINKRPAPRPADSLG